MLVVTPGENEKTFKSSEPTPESAGRSEVKESRLAANKSYTVTMEKEEPAKRDSPVKKEKAAAVVECNRDAVVVEDVSRSENEKSFTSREVKSARAKQAAAFDTNISAESHTLTIMELEDDIKPDEVEEKVASVELVVNRSPVTVEDISNDDSVVRRDVTDTIKEQTASERSCNKTNLAAQREERIVLEAEKPAVQTTQREERIVLEDVKKDESTVCNVKEIPSEKRADTAEIINDNQDSIEKKKDEVKIKKEKAQDSSTNCSKKSADREGENVSEALTKKRKTGKKKKAQTQVESSNEPLKVECDKNNSKEKIIPGQREEETSPSPVKRVTIVEPQTEDSKPVPAPVSQSDVSTEVVTVQKTTEEEKERTTEPQLTARVPDLEFEFEADEGVAVTNMHFQDLVKSAAGALADRFRPGVSVTEVVTELSVEQRNVIRRPETQVALMSVAKRIGNAPSIHNIVIQEIAENQQTTESFGSKALFSALETNEAAGKDVASFFKPKDFDTSKSKAVLCQVLNEAHEIESHQKQSETFLSAIKCLVEETKEGKTVSEIITERTPREMEEMQCIESQMAIVGALEKLGHGDVTENMIAEQMSTDRIGLLNVIGTKALSSVLQQKEYSTEKIMGTFQPEDFEREQVKEKVAQILNKTQEINEGKVEVQVEEEN